MDGQNEIDVRLYLYKKVKSDLSESRPCWTNTSLANLDLKFLILASSSKIIDMSKQHNQAYKAFKFLRLDISVKINLSKQPDKAFKVDKLQRLANLTCSYIQSKV